MCLLVRCFKFLYGFPSQGVLQDLVGKNSIISYYQSTLKVQKWVACTKLHLQSSLSSTPQSLAFDWPIKFISINFLRSSPHLSILFLWSNVWVGVNHNNHPTRINNICKLHLFSDISWQIYCILPWDNSSNPLLGSIVLHYQEQMKRNQTHTYLLRFFLLWIKVILTIMTQNLKIVTPSFIFCDIIPTMRIFKIEKIL